MTAAPNIQVIHHASPSPRNREGIKGAGEGGTIGALATIARAVENALETYGIEINDLPIRADWLARECRVRSPNYPTRDPAS
jgi:CO/xanthine dehydrogenase Mo-binding subunit